jgi:hypothetical protein
MKVNNQPTSQPLPAPISSSGASALQKQEELGKAEAEQAAGKDEYTGIRQSGDPINQNVNTPIGSALTQALATLRSDSSNPSNKTQSQRLNNGQTVLFENVGGKSKFAVFNMDGSQAAPKTGWQQIDPKTNGGKGSLGLGNGQTMNFDTNGFTVDDSSKNKGTPLGYDSQGNIGVGTQTPTPPGSSAGYNIGTIGQKLK